MSTAQLAAPFEERREPALVRAVALSLGMHLLLLALLLLGVNWQSREPEAVVVELYRPPPLAAPAPVVEPPAPPTPTPATNEVSMRLPDASVSECVVSWNAPVVMAVMLITCAPFTPPILERRVPAIASLFVATNA